MREGRGPRPQYEHPVQREAAAFLRALAEGDAPRVWERLSRESRGLLEGRYAARAQVAFAHAAGVEASSGDARLGEAVAPLIDAAMRSMGGAARVNGFGVSVARVLDRETAYVLLLPAFGEERMVAEAEWRPEHLLAFTYESRTWLVDLGKTSLLSAESGLADPLGDVRA